MKGTPSPTLPWLDTSPNHYHRRSMCIYIVDGEHMIGFIIFIALQRSLPNSTCKMLKSIKSTRDMFQRSQLINKRSWLFWSLAATKFNQVFIVVWNFSWMWVTCMVRVSSGPLTTSLMFDWWHTQHCRRVGRVMTMIVICLKATLSSSQRFEIISPFHIVMAQTISSHYQFLFTDCFKQRMLNEMLFHPVTQVRNISYGVDKTLWNREILQCCYTKQIFQN